MATKQEAFQKATGSLISYSGPIIKNVSFNPKPVAGNIPFFADSVSNPRCVGTRLHREWWDEQFYLMQNGYTTAGTFIPPIYYQYLNYQKISGLMGRQYPDFTDTHYRLYRVSHEIKKHNILGLITPKARRKGISLFGTSIANNGIRFIDEYRMGVAAGLEGYVKGFRNKLYGSFNDCPPEMQIGYLLKNKDEFKTGWEEEAAIGMIEFITSVNLFRTMKGDATKMEGEYFNDVFAEESGQFENVEEFVTSILPTMDVGSYTMGTLYIWGTGGNTMKASKGFKDLWHASESLGLIRFPVLGNEYYYPYYIGAKEKDGTIPVETKALEKELLGQGYQPSQIIGCEDHVKAEKEIREERARLAKNPNKKFLIEWNQKYPLSVEEIFTSGGSNNFNNDLLYGQAYDVESSVSDIHQVVLEWVKDTSGNIVIPLQVTYRPFKPGDRDWQIVEMLRPPMPGIKDLDIAGIDSYNEDVSTTSKSLGCMNVVRRFDEFKIPGEAAELNPLSGRTIICQFYKRPPRKEQFFEICLMISVLYNIVKNTMCSAESDLVMQFYKNWGAAKYLSPRPKSFDAPSGELLNDYGAKMTGYSKPRMVGLIQTWVEDFIQWCKYIRTIQDLISYDDQNIGTDYDSVDALGLCLMRIEDMKRKPRSDNNEELRKSLELPSYSSSDIDISENNGDYQAMIKELFVSG
jgi:hypothetical protein